MNTPYAHGRQPTTSRLIASLLAAAFVLAGCGGGGGSTSKPGQGSQQPPTPPVGAPTPEDLNPNLLGEAFASYWNQCASPRTGLDAEGKPFPDKQGTLLDELKFLRAWSNQYYLWYNEIPNTFKMADYRNAIDYFDVLKTPAVTESGRPKDMYHYTVSTEEWNKMQNAGIELGYGVTWKASSSTAPRTWLVAQVEPGSPAASAGLRRGDLLLKVDSDDFVHSEDEAAIDRINAALFPEAGGTHRFTVQRGTATLEVAMAGKEVKVDPVKHVQVLGTPSGKVGYLAFESHNAVSEKELMDAFTTFKQEGVNDLVLDLRYNGGGLLYIASELSYMIAGPAQTAGKGFLRYQLNDKTPPEDALPFLGTAYGFASPNPAAAGAPLPYLGLKRVIVLATEDSCSASEAVINGLRGADVQVDVIGSATCGKPYGFTPTPNCGTTYFSVEFKAVNHKGFGDYADGLAPTCQAADDLSRPLGDPSEGLLAAALSYRQSGICPPIPRARQMPMSIVRHPARTIAIRSKARS